jgi:hypothetical protein
MEPTLYRVPEIDAVALVGAILTANMLGKPATVVMNPLDRLLLSRLPDVVSTAAGLVSIATDDSMPGGQFAVLLADGSEAVRGTTG